MSRKLPASGPGDRRGRGVARAAAVRPRRVRAPGGRRRRRAAGLGPTASVPNSPGKRVRQTAALWSDLDHPRHVSAGGVGRGGEEERHVGRRVGVEPAERDAGRARSPRGRSGAALGSAARRTRSSRACRPARTCLRGGAKSCAWPGAVDDRELRTPAWAPDDEAAGRRDRCGVRRVEAARGETREDERVVAQATRRSGTPSAVASATRMSAGRGRRVAERDGVRAGAAPACGARSTEP